MLKAKLTTKLRYKLALKIFLCPVLATLQMPSNISQWKIKWKKFGLQKSPPPFRRHLHCHHNTKKVLNLSLKAGNKDKAELKSQIMEQTVWDAGTNSLLMNQQWSGDSLHQVQQEKKYQTVTARLQHGLSAKAL